jgi:hypothetical protein
MKAFLVVVFPEDKNDIDVISSTWILPPLSIDKNSKEKLCRYPPKQIRGTKLVKLVREHQVPSSDWLIFSCRVLGEFGKNNL